MIDLVEAVRAESERFHEVITRTSMDAPVPSCPGWTVADLTWHLIVVQHRFGVIVDELLLDTDSVPRLARPEIGGLARLFRSKSAKLVEALARRNSADACYSWKPAGDRSGGLGAGRPTKH